MVEHLASRPRTNSPSRSEDEVVIEARILTEYGEMPGLSLTLPQAARLFNLDMTRCAQLLEDLILDGALWTNGHEFLGRNMSGRCVKAPLARSCTNTCIACRSSGRK